MANSAPIHAFLEFFFNQYFPQYSFKATGCFSTKPLTKQWTVVREEWILLQWLSSILGKNIGQARNHTSDLLFSSRQRYQLSYGARLTRRYKEWFYHNTIHLYTLTTQFQLLTTVAKKPFENIVGKGECWLQAFSPFPTIFSNLSKATKVISWNI